MRLPQCIVDQTLERRIFFVVRHFIGVKPTEPAVRHEQLTNSIGRNSTLLKVQHLYHEKQNLPSACYLMFSTCARDSHTEVLSATLRTPVGQQILGKSLSGKPTARVALLVGGRSLLGFDTSGSIT